MELMKNIKNIYFIFFYGLINGFGIFFISVTIFSDISLIFVLVLNIFSFLILLNKFDIDYESFKKKFLIIFLGNISIIFFLLIIDYLDSKFHFTWGVIIETSFYFPRKQSFIESIKSLIYIVLGCILFSLIVSLIQIYVLLLFRKFSRKNIREI